MPDDTKTMDSFEKFKTDHGTLAAWLGATLSAPFIVIGICLGIVCALPGLILCVSVSLLRDLINPRTVRPPKGETSVTSRRSLPRPTAPAADLWKRLKRCLSVFALGRLSLAVQLDYRRSSEP